ncbi:hypothetical protein JW921_04310 [Candidatus Fermentibacterales bacterium]|nr:hypothetical protein [Candidatus Fermentibacterales bacterium]
MRSIARARLPYQRTFLERVPLRFVNLKELSKGALESRDLAEDGYWQIDADQEAVAFLVLYGGRPHQLVGHRGPTLSAFLRWLATDKRELVLTYRFVQEGLLPHLFRCWTEDPALQGLSHIEGDIKELLKGLSSSGESGLLAIRSGGEVCLVPVDKGTLSIGYGAGQVVNGNSLIKMLSSGLSKDAEADFYPGATRPLPAIGISEVGLLIQSFNDWLEAIRPTWPSCDKLAEAMYEKLQAREDCIRSISYEPGDGLVMNELPEDTANLAKIFVVLIKSLTRRHPSPDNAVKVFAAVNRENRIALVSAGLGSLLE